ncbi:ATP-grasp domain-containing protein [Methylomagnum sp.]
MFEYITGGGLLAEPIPPSLAREGGLMLGALLRDLADIPGVRPVALRDARLAVPPDLSQRVEWIWLDRHADAEQCFRKQVALAEAVWPIAPETGGILERLCQWVEPAGKPLLTSPATAVRLTASKRETLRRLAPFWRGDTDCRSGFSPIPPPDDMPCRAEARPTPAPRRRPGVMVVPTVPVEKGAGLGFPLVVKPDDGVGCEGTRIIATRKDWQAFLANPPAGRYIAQPFLEGESLSLSALFAAGRACLLTCNHQHIARQDSGFVLTGCGVNAAHQWRDEFESLAARIAAALPELWGYAGVDVIRSERGLTVLEVNPRLTTSYAGLREALGANPAELVLNLWRQGRLPECPAYSSNVVEISLESSHAH